MARRNKQREILRGEVWQVNFKFSDPNVPPGPPTGSEPKHPRPAVVMGVRDIGLLPLRIVVPITTGHEMFEFYRWMVHLPASKENGLDHDSWADAFQITCASTQLFVDKRGDLETELLSKIAEAILLSIGHEL